MKDRMISKYWLRFIEGAPAGAPAPAPGATTGAPAPAEGAPAPGTPPEGQGDPTEGPAGGIEALRADLAAERDRRQATEAQFATLQQQLQQAFGVITGQGEAGQGDQAPTMESLLAEVQAIKDRDQQREEEATQRIIDTEIRSAATALQFHNPEDALSRILEVETTEDGKPDIDWIQAEVKKIAEASPYLIQTTAGTGTASAQDAGIGATGTGIEPAAGKSRIAAGLAKTSVPRARRQ